MKKIQVGILGCGTVGTGVAKLLMGKKDLIQSRVGTEIILKHVADIDLETDRGITFEKEVLTADAQAVINDPEIDIIIEMIGGTGIAKTFILNAMDSGKHVVTANKALLATHGNELFKHAGQKGLEFGYEASVGGCMPIIKSLRESLVSNHIQSMTGILNGTCNYILSKITQDHSTFEQALAEAQAKGFAEADSTLDVEGFDTAHKLAILGALAYGTTINLDDIFVEGISKITPLDITFAEQFGYRIKLLAISKKRKASFEARIHPTMIPADNLMANVSGSLNAVAVTGDAVGDTMLFGHGAGMMPTASAVLSDVVDIARNITCGSIGRVPGLSFQPEKIKTIPVMPITDLETHYYFRFSAQDRPGVLSKISGVLGDHDISLKSVIQKGRKAKGTVPIIMLTHLACEANVMTALDKLGKLDVISDQPMLIRIEDSSLSH